MERKRISQLQVRAAILVALFLQNLVVPVVVMADAANFEDQKNFFFPPYPYPGTPTTPPVSYTSPPRHGGQATPTPSHGGGGHLHGSPPHAHASSPPTPSRGTSGGGHYNSPPTKPLTPPTTPAGTTPSPPLLPVDPNSPPFTCTYWRTHPTLIWGLVGWWGLTMSSAFGVASLPGTGAGYGSHMNLLQALSNTRTDGFGQLYREGTAALLNSMAHTKFAYTTMQVRDSFVAALSSNKAAAAQAHLFKMANNRRE